MVPDLDAAVIVALGCSLQGPYDSRQDLLEAALERFSGADIRITDRSSWWRSASWPDPSQPGFVNGVVIVQTRLSPRSLMAFLIGLEASFGRLPGEANAPRTLDLDLIAHGRTVMRTAGLTLPHHRARERKFVMAPLAEIAPTWPHPETGETAHDLALEATVGRDAERLP